MRTPTPIVIAHRGASGYLPEHTLEAKALAYGLGADFLEQDVVATKDRQLVVLHDLYLDDVSDVAEIYPERRREDGRRYAIDFELRELERLTLRERRRPQSDTPRFAARFPFASSAFRIATLEQELTLVRGLNRSMGRAVGVYPEIKHPEWHRAHGIDLAALVLEKLAAHGYRDRDDGAFVQCFDAAELRRIRRELGCELKLVQLVGTEPEHAGRLTPAGLAAIAEYADGIGPAFTQLLAAPDAPKAGGVAADAHALGLVVHPYTFRRDELPGYVSSLEQLLELFLVDVGVDGVFCDHPDVAVAARAKAFRRPMDNGAATT